MSIVTHPCLEGRGFYILADVGSVRAVVRCNHTERLVGSRRETYRLAHRTLGTLVFLPEETLYLGTSKHYRIGSRRVNGWNPETLLTPIFR